MSRVLREFLAVFFMCGLMLAPFALTDAPWWAWVLYTAVLVVVLQNMDRLEELLS